jgi:hypothetical protein
MRAEDLVAREALAVTRRLLDAVMVGELLVVTNGQRGVGRERAARFAGSALTPLSCTTASCS